MNKIIFITDLHLSFSPDIRNGVPMLENFQNVLNELKKETYEYLIIGGDICYNQGEIEIYQYCKEKLDNLNKPYYVIPGNHDESEMISKVFDLPLHNKETYSKQLISGSKFLFLDTAIGKMSDSQWNWLEVELLKSSNTNDELFIIMHHPPCETYISYFDNSIHMFKEIERWDNLMEKFDLPSCKVFCGHYHCELMVEKPRYTVYLTPSTYLQFDDRSSTFKEDHRNPAYRRVWWEKGVFYSSVKYLMT